MSNSVKREPMPNNSTLIIYTFHSVMYINLSLIQMAVNYFRKKYVSCVNDV